MKWSLVILFLLPLFTSSALASASLSDGQLDNVCSGSAGCCPAGLCSGGQWALVAQLSLLNSPHNNRLDLANDPHNSPSASYTLLSGQAAAAAVRALMNAK